MSPDEGRARNGEGKILLLGIVLSLLALWLLSEPALWLLGIWFGAGVVGALGGGSSSKRALWFNLAVLLAVVGGGALFFSDREGEIQVEGDNPEYRTVKHEALGYRPNPGQKAQLRKFTDDEVIYDIAYTIQENGLRLSPPHIESEGKPCVLFFGGSHMFGEGVNDEEALPYRFGIETGGRYEVHNFGFSGYGTHQMLAALESGFVESAIDCNPRHVIYQGGYFHVPRAAGLSSWDKEGPYFESVSSDAVEFRGGFDEQEEPDDIFSNLIGLTGLDSVISGLHRPPDGRDYDRVVGILENSRRYVEENYPEAEFHVFFMDDKRRGPIPFYSFAWSRPPLPETLKERGFHVLHRRDALPDLEERPDLYRIHPQEGHPNAMAQALMAEYLAGELSPEAPPSSAGVKGP
ncbi:MAG: hypothetical protein VX252_17510 [Myxococcota bacterium]|nr:hypothetical protein [Myxococcota bacterium]